jgi:hypothetical protein
MRISLVANQTGDVPRVIDTLKLENVDVEAVFWLYRSEGDQWYLYIVSRLVDQIGITEAYKSVFRVMKTLAGLRIDRFQVKLVSPSDTIAKAIADFLRMRHAPSPTEIRSSTVGGLYIEHAYVY